MSQSDKLKLARWKRVNKNSEFEDPTDQFHPHTRRYQIELSRYLSSVNLNFLPPMPKPTAHRTKNATSLNQQLRGGENNVDKTTAANYNDNSKTHNSMPYNMNMSSTNASHVTNINQMTVTSSTSTRRC